MITKLCGRAIRKIKMCNLEKWRGLSCSSPRGLPLRTKVRVRVRVRAAGQIDFQNYVHRYPSEYLLPYWIAWTLVKGTSTVLSFSFPGFIRVSFWTLLKEICKRKLGAAFIVCKYSERSKFVSAIPGGGLQVLTITRLRPSLVPPPPGIACQPFVVYLYCNVC